MLVVAENAVVSTEDAKVATTVSNRLIDELPLVVGGAMRSPFDLLSTVPEARGSGSSTSLGGGQGGSFGATLDGISVNTNRQGDTGETAFLTPSLEAITEFQVETNGFKPEFGQAGGGSITFASKSGTNNLTGSVRFFRHESLDKSYRRPRRYNSDVGARWAESAITNCTADANARSSSCVRRVSTKAGQRRFRACRRPKMWDGTYQWGERDGQRIKIYVGDDAGRPTRGAHRDPSPRTEIRRTGSRDGQQYIALARSALCQPVGRCRTSAT